MEKAFSISIWQIELRQLYWLFLIDLSENINLYILLHKQTQKRDLHMDSKSQTCNKTFIQMRLSTELSDVGARVVKRDIPPTRLFAHVHCRDFLWRVLIKIKTSEEIIIAISIDFLELNKYTDADIQFTSFIFFIGNSANIPGTTL